MTLQIENIHKQRARDQWVQHPCGYLEDAGFPSREYFECLDESRYVEYAPWMREEFGFDSHGDQDLLEIGFGQGTDLFQFARYGSRVSGVDLSDRHLSIARTRFELAGVAARLLLADGEELPFEQQSFDHVYSFGVLHHSPDMPRAISEIHRVLRPGGTCTVAVYHRMSAFHMFQKILTDGLLKGVLFRRGYRYLMASVEEGGTATLPLVRTYSVRKMRRMFDRFRVDRIAVRHLDRIHFGSLQRFFRLDREWIERRESTLGWYVIAHCTKVARSGSSGLEE